MKVHITCTPNFSKDKLKEVVDLLKGIPGVINFEMSDPASESLGRKYFLTREDLDDIGPLPFNDFFDYIDSHRESNIETINEEDYVALITPINNNQFWFSSFSNKNIFIHSAEWDIYSKVDTKYSIAHQVVENIFQSLIKLNVDNPDNEPNIHKDSIGCINDFCGYKLDIRKKFQTANICPSCFQRAMKMDIDKAVLAHILTILNMLRMQFVDYSEFMSNYSSESVEVDEEGNIMIDGQIVRMEMLPKTLYIYFLINSKGLPKNKLCAEEPKFEKIYKALKKNDNAAVNSVKKMCCGQIDTPTNTIDVDQTLRTYKSKANGALKRILGNIIGNKYSLNLVGKTDEEKYFKIDIDGSIIKIAPTFEI